MSEETKGPAPPRWVQYVLERWEALEAKHAKAASDRKAR